MHERDDPIFFLFVVPNSRLFLQVSRERSTLKYTGAHFQVNSVLEEQLVYQVIFLSYFSFPPNKLEGNIGQ